MLDLTSSLYLGLHHPSSRLPGWSSLTLGKPAALAEPPAVAEITGRLGRLVGMPSVRLWTSTLHAFTDLSVALSASRPDPSIGVDVAAYPIGRLGLTAGHGASGRRSHRLPHYDVGAARRWAAREAALGRTPVLLVDGWCPGCGRVAPLAGLSRAVRSHQGLVVVDDTQALGLLGAVGRGRGPVGSASAGAWGHGGGGSVVHTGSPAGMVMVASLAKAFGVPMAVIAGPADLVASSWQRGPTVVHSSPPSTPVGLAAIRALTVNERVGDQLRQRLLALIDRLHRRLGRQGIRIVSGHFPVARVSLPNTAAAARVVHALETSGIRAVPLGASCLGRPAVGLALNAGLAPGDIDRAADAVGLAMRRAA